MKKVQYHESNLFLSYFQKIGITYLDGGHASALNKIDDIKRNPRLFMVKGKKDIRIVQVPLEYSSLNKSDVFILDDNSRIFIWNTINSNPMERLRV